MKRLFFALGLIVAALSQSSGARAAPHSLTWGLDTSLNPASICLQYTSASCLPIGTMSAAGAFIPNLTNIPPLAVANGGSGTATPALIAGNNVFLSGAWPNTTLNANVYGLNVKGPPFNAKGNGVTLVTAVTTAGSPSLAASSAAFTAGDVGKVIRVQDTNTVTISNASPAVVTWTGSNMVAGTLVQFTTTGALPTGLTASVWYCVIAGGLTSNAFEVANTCGGAALNTSSAGSGVHTAITQQSFATTILAFVDATHVTMTSNAISTVSGAMMTYGTDDTAAIQAALNASGAAATAISKCIYIPQGAYLTTSTLTISGGENCITGDGLFASQIQPDISISALTITSISPQTIRNIGITPITLSAAGTSGISLSSSGANFNSSTTIRDAQIVGSNNCITATKTAALVVDNLKCESFQTAGISISNNLTPNDAGDNIITNSYIQGFPSLTETISTECVFWSGGGAFHFQNNNCLNATFGVFAALPSGAGTSQIQITGNTLDNGSFGGMTGARFTRLGATGTFVELIFAGNHCNGSFTCLDIPVDGNGNAITTVIANDNTVWGQSQAGSPIFFNFNSVTNIISSGNAFQGNSAGTEVYFVGGTASTCTIGPNTKTGTIGVVDANGIACQGDLTWFPFTATPTCGTATFTVNSARQKKINDHTTAFETDVTVTALGTCAANNYTFTMPSTSNSAAAFAGKEFVTTGFIMGCSVPTASSTVTCTAAAGGVLAAALINDRFVVSGIYENQ